MCMPAATTDPFLREHWTAADLRALPDDGKRYEIIDGELFVSPSPTYTHQHLVTQIWLLLHQYATGNGFGRAMISPADIELSDDTVVQPDVFVFPTPAGKHIERWEDIGRLLLAVEILSPGTARTDRTVKRRRYQREGIPEYWIVDSDSHLIERWRPTDDRPEILGERLEWQPVAGVPPLVIELAALFEGVGPG